MASAEIREGLVAVVAVHRKSLLIDVRHEKILAAVLVEIGRVNAHARASQAIFAIPYARSQSDLFEFLTSPVHKQKVGNRIVGLKQVEIAIIVNVRGDHAEAFAQAFQNRGLFADVGEMPATVISVEVTRHWVKHAWDAIVDLCFRATFHFAAVGIGASAAL